MNKRTGTCAVGLLLAAGALSVSCGDDGNGGTATAGTASGGSAVAGSPAGGTSSGNGSGGSTAGTGGKAAGGDANSGGAATAGEANAGGNDGSLGGMPGESGGAPTSAGGESQGGMGGAPPEPTAGQGPVVDGGAGGAGGAGAAECLAVDEAPCESGVDAACTNDDGEFCFCFGFGQSEEWSCVEPGGQGGAGPGGFSADCGANPMSDGDCDGFGPCEGSSSCFCLQGNVVCQ